MKVTIDNEIRKYIMVCELPIIKKIIDDMKDSDETAKYRAKHAMHIITGDCNAKIFEAKAEIHRNSRVYNLYTDDSDHFDIWISFYALSEYSNEFIEGGVYLSDLWQACEENYEEIRQRMFVRRFIEH